MTELPPENDWKQQLSDCFTDVLQLCQYLQIRPKDLPLLTGFKTFPLKVPQSFVDCMNKGDPSDPLLLQVLTQQQELSHASDYIDDPVGDLPAIAETGVIHKYQGRALLIVTAACAVNCRYCFRRHFPYNDHQLSLSRHQQALAYLDANADIEEVILSGGDPLLLSDDKLQHLLAQISEIRHIKRIRIHSRVPVVLPARITAEFLTLCKQSPKPLIMVIHANHVNELSPAVNDGCRSMKNADVTLLNQSVLLRNVNDSVDALCQLSEKLFACGVMPYYLHLLDKAKGTQHFDVDENRAIALITAVKKILPGYLVPKLVREVAGAPYKISLS